MKLVQGGTMVFCGVPWGHCLSKPLGRVGQQGSIPLVVLVAGVGFAVATGSLARMGDRLRSDSEARKREMAEQGNRSAVSVLKQLLSSVDGKMPAVFPDPYIRNSSDFSTKFAKLSSLNSAGWSLAQTSSSSELTVLTIDPRKSDFSTAFSGTAAVDPRSGSGIQISRPGLTAISSNIAYVDSIETIVQIPDPVKPTKMLKTKVCLQLSTPPVPTCQLQADIFGLSLLVSGAAVSGTVIDSASGTRIASYDRNSVATGSATADSIYGQDIKVVSTRWSDLPPDLLGGTQALTFIGDVKGVSGGSTSCSATFRPASPTPDPPLEPEEAGKLSCNLKMVQGALEYWGGQRVLRHPQLIVKVRDGISGPDTELAGTPEVVQLGSGSVGSGEWSKPITAFLGCEYPPCYRGVFKGRSVWKPGHFSVRIKDTDGNTALCQAFNYGAWDGTWRRGEMAYSEAHIGAWAKGAAKENGISIQENPRLRASNTIAYSAANIERLCALKGMKPYSSDSQGSEKRRNYTSCHDDSHWTFRDSKMIKVPACSAQWIATLICN